MSSPAPGSCFLTFVSFCSNSIFLSRLSRLGALIVLGTTPPASALPPPLPPGQAAEWKLIDDLSSDFTGPALDRNKFFDFLPLQFFDDGDLQRDLSHHPDARFVPVNTSVREGWLHLEARPGLPAADGTSARYTLPALSTRRLLRHGYVEIRAIAAPAALTSAFWLNKQNTVVRQPLGSPWQLGPYQGGCEIDVFEICGRSHHLGIDGARRNNQNCLVYADLKNPGNGVADDNTNQLSHTEYDIPRGTPAFTEAPHVFGLEWTDQSLKWFVDGTLKRETPMSDVSWQIARYNTGSEPKRGTGLPFGGTRFARHLFNLPLQVILNVEYIPDWHGPLDPATLPAAMKVDYLRVWQKRGTGPELIRNGTFATLSPWVPSIAPDALAKVKASAGQATFEIQHAGPRPDSIRLAQTGLPLQPDTSYSLSYEAAATRPHWFHVVLRAGNGTPLARYREFIPQDGPLANGHTALYSHEFKTPPAPAPGLATLTLETGGPDDPGQPQDHRTVIIRRLSLKSMRPK
jgi:hypothetical protein